MTFCPPVQTLTFGATSGTGQTVGSSDGWEAPLAGNGILVVGANADRLSNLVAPNGYTSIGEQGANNCPVVTGFAKIADGTESSIDLSWSRDSQWVVAIFEFDAQDMEVDPSKFGNGATDTNTDSLSSTTTSSVQGFAMALFASLAQNGETPSYTNSFAHLLSVLAGGSSDLVLDIGVGSVNADSEGTYETTASWTSSTGRTSRCIAANMVMIDGEWKKDYQRSSTYKVINGKGQTAYTPEGEVMISGKNRGQARKLMAQLAPSKGPFRLEVEHE